MSRGHILKAGPEGNAAAAECIRSGGVVVYPTDTVYGIGADPGNAAAVERVIGLKGREATKGIILLVRDETDLTDLVDDVPGSAHKLMRAFWPGPLTLVFKARAGLPPNLIPPQGTVALRVSDSAVCVDLLERVDGPITGTSANRSGRGPALSATQALDTIGSDVDLILDGGTASNPIPSTLVNVAVSPPRLLREGSIGLEALAEALGIPVARG